MLLLAGVLQSCSGSNNVDIMFACPSPSGNRVATLYRVAPDDNPTHHTMHINIRYADSPFSTNMPSFSFQHGYDASIVWHNDHAMSITYPLDSKVLHQETVVFGSSQIFRPSDSISVQYQEKPSTHGYFLIEQRCFNKPEGDGE